MISKRKAVMIFEFEPVDHKGRPFDRFYPARSPASGPGWYIFGRNPEYGDSLIKLCARPAVAPRAHPRYNIKVRHGWPTLREARAIADQLNSK